jgi:CHAT domain-containing protein
MITKRTAASNRGVGVLAFAGVLLAAILVVASTQPGPAIDPLPRAPMSASVAASIKAEYIKLLKLLDASRYEEFIEQAPAYLSRVERYFDPTTDAYFGILNKLPDAYASLGRWSEGEPYEKRMLELYEANLGPNAPQVAGALQSLASTYRFSGRYEESERLLRRAVAICEQATCLYRAGYIGSLGHLYGEMGRYAEAEALLTRAVSLEEKGVASPSRAETVQNLAYLYISLGRDEEAEALLKRAENILVGTKRSPTERAEYRPLMLAANMEYLATLRSRQGRYADAERLLKQAIETRRKMKIFPDAAKAQVFGYLSRVYLAQARYVEAEPLLKLTLETERRLIGYDNHWAVENLDTLGVVYTRMQRYDEARPLFETAIDSIGRSIGKKSPDAAPVFSHFATLQLATGRIKEALELSRQAVQVTQASLESETASKERIDLASIRGHFLTHLDALRRARDEAILGPEAAAEAFGVAQWAAQSAAAAALSNLGVRLASGNDQLALRIREHQDLSANRRMLEKSLLLMQSQPAATRNVAREQDAQTRIGELERRLAQLDRAIAAEFPDYAALRRPQSLDIESVRRLLSADEALALFLPGSSESHVFVLTTEGFEWKTIAIGAEDLIRKVANFRRGLDVDDVGNISDQIETSSKAKLFDLAGAHDLYRDLLGPVEALIRGKQKLVVVPAGVLTALPFHLLVTEQPAAAVPERLSDYREAAWLIKRHALTVMPSVASLKALRGFSRRDGAAKPLIGFGDPVFDPDERTASSDQRGRRLPATTRGFATFWQGAGVDRARLAKLARLADTADELKTVAASLGASPSDILLREAATESAVKRRPLVDYRVVYFATHGLVAGDVNGVAEPSLVLSLPARASSEDDGLLTASEVAQLKLNADWVVLSACNTIAGDKPGAEALSGLARAFFYSGARALLVSHWSVDSAAATALTTTTFAALRMDRQLGRAEALRNAMLAYMADPAHPRQAYPAYWAPFQIVGEGRAR